MFPDCHGKIKSNFTIIYPKQNCRMTILHKNLRRKSIWKRRKKKKKKEWLGTRGKVSSDSDDRLDIIIKCDNV